MEREKGFEVGLGHCRNHATAHALSPQPADSTALSTDTQLLPSSPEFFAVLLRHGDMLGDGPPKHRTRPALSSDLTPSRARVSRVPRAHYERRVTLETRRSTW